jgi:glycosyltransferase involved in cell wall biosynthesis
LAGGHLTFTGCSESICREGRRGAGTWHAVHNGVSLKAYTFRPTVPADAPLFFLSRIERIKGAHTAIAAARQSGKRLILAGNHAENGEEKTYWDREIVPFLGKDGIEYIGPVNDQQKNEWLGKVSALIVPIEWEEPFGIVFAEALTCGTPVISCPRGALPEIIRQGVEGYLVNNVAEAVKAIQNLGGIDRAACRRRAEEAFSAEYMVDRYEQLYQSLVRMRKAA